jgi:hypothetical protein
MYGEGTVGVRRSEGMAVMSVWRRRELQLVNTNANTYQVRQALKLSKERRRFPPKAL